MHVFQALNGKIPLSWLNFFIHLRSFFNAILMIPLSLFIVGEYLCLAEVQWVQTEVPGVKPLLGVKDIFP